MKALQLQNRSARDELRAAEEAAVHLQVRAPCGRLQGQSFCFGGSKGTIVKISTCRCPALTAVGA